LAKIERIALRRIGEQNFPVRSGDGRRPEVLLPQEPLASSSTSRPRAPTSAFFASPAADQLYAESAASNEDQPYDQHLWRHPVANPADIVNKEIITLEKAQLYWESFHKSAAPRMGWRNEVAAARAVREASPCLFAACCSVGARLAGDLQAALRCLDEAKVLAHYVLFYDELHSRGTQVGDLKGLLVLCLFWNMPHTVGYIVR
jgi:hypothetical protein